MSQVCRVVVPSDSWPSVAAAVADVEDGTEIHIQRGYSEVLTAPLIIDKAVHIEGPEGGHALIESEESIIIAPGKSGLVVLKRLELKIVGVPALIIAGGCHLEHCSVDGADVGIEVAAHAGSSVCIQGSVVQNCRLGISLSGGADVSLEGSHIQKCSVGCSVTGMVIEEGWNAKLGSLSKAKFVDNTEADLTLRGWSVEEKGSESVRFSAPDGEVVVKGWPAEAVNVVAPTESGAVVLLFNGGQVNATLFETEEEDEEEEDVGSEDDEPVSPATRHRMSNLGQQSTADVFFPGGCEPPSPAVAEDLQESFTMETLAPSPMSRVNSVAREADPPQDGEQAESEQKQKLEEEVAPITSVEVANSGDSAESPLPPPIV